MLSCQMVIRLHWKCSIRWWWYWLIVITIHMTEYKSKRKKIYLLCLKVRIIYIYKYINIYMLWLIRQMVIRHRWRCSGRCRGKRGNERWLPLISKQPNQENTQNDQENNVQFVTSITNSPCAKIFFMEGKNLRHNNLIELITSRCLQMRWVLNANNQ